MWEKTYNLHDNNFVREDFVFAPVGFNGDRVGLLTIYWRGCEELTRLSESQQIGNGRSTAVSSTNKREIGSSSDLIFGDSGFRKSGLRLFTLRPRLFREYIN